MRVVFAFVPKACLAACPVVVGGFVTDAVTVILQWLEQKDPSKAITEPKPELRFYWM